MLPPIREHRHADLEQRDANDIPFYAVLREASGEALLTTDNDLLDTIGEATTAAELMELLRKYTRQKAVALGASGQIYVGAIAVSCGGSLFMRAAKAGLAAFGQLPWWAQVGIVIGGVWLARHQGARAWVAERLQQLSSTIETTLPLIEQTVRDVAT